MKSINNFINEIKKWPLQKKRNFSLFLAILLTVLVIILNFALNAVWSEKKDDIPRKNAQFESMKNSFSEIFDQAGSALEQTFSSSTEIIEQIKLASTSSSTPQ